MDASPARAAEIASEFKTKAFTDHRELLGLADAVSVVTPTESHCRIGLDFLSRGVHVMMEKPIAVTVAEADALVQEAQRSKAVLQVGHLERFNGAMLALGGRIKDPLYIESFRLSPFPNRGADVDVILDLMIHDIDLVLSIAASEVETVEAFAVPVVSPKADFANARLRFRNGVVANLTASRVSKDRARKINIIQPDACITIDYGNQELKFTRTLPHSPGAIATQADEDIAVEKKDAILEELKSFLECVRTGKPPLVSGADGKKALEVAEMVQEAARLLKTPLH